jgi:DNA-binding transcriptional LysR family regulator
MLERRLGEPLFLKGRRPLQPTPLGRALADPGQAMLAASRKASELVDSFRPGQSGVVRVGGTPFFMDALISTMIAEFHNAHPDVRVDQSHGYLPDLRAAILADRIDLAICPVDILEEGSGLSFREILPGRNVVACRTGHPLVARRRIGGGELLNFPWVAPPPGSPLHDDLRSLLLSFGATEIKIRYSGGSLASAVNYLKHTDALAVLPHSVVFAYRNDKSITALPVKVPHPERALGLLRSEAAPRAPATDAFARLVEDSFGKLRLLISRHEQAVIWGG